MPAFCLAVGKSLDPYQAGSTKGAGESISPHEFQHWGGNSEPKASAIGGDGVPTVGERSPEQQTSAAPDLRQGEATSRPTSTIQKLRRSHRQGYLIHN